MRRVLPHILAAALIFAIPAPIAGAGDGAPDVERAKAKAVALFEKFRQLEKDGDERLADLYDDTAVIRAVSGKENGKFQFQETRGADYRKLLRLLSSKFRAPNDRVRYENVEFKPENDKYRITATVYMQGEALIFGRELLVGATPSAEWLIFEDASSIKGENPVEYRN